MNTKMMKKMGSIFLVVALMASLSPMGVFAVGTSAVKNVEITKKILKANDVYAPATTFEFQIKAGAPTTENDKPIKAGIDGAVTFEKASVTSAPKTEDIGKDNIVLTEKAKLAVDASKFPGPGIYRYVVSEKASTYKGFKANTEEKYFDVYVKKGDAGLEAYSYAFVKTNDTKTKDDGVFTNDYRNEDPNGDNWLTKLTVSKKVTGLLGDKDKEFTFKVTVNGQAGEKFNLVNSNGTTAVLENGVQQEVKLKHDQNFYITGLSVDDTVTINENDYTADGYKATYVPERHEGMTTTKDAMTLEVTNDNDSTPPTGIVMTYGPYALLVLVAGAILVTYGRRRRNYEED